MVFTKILLVAVALVLMVTAIPSPHGHHLGKPELHDRPHDKPRHHPNPDHDRRPDLHDKPHDKPRHHINPDHNRPHDKPRHHIHPDHDSRPELHHGRPIVPRKHHPHGGKPSLPVSSPDDRAHKRIHILGRDHHISFRQVSGAFRLFGKYFQKQKSHNAGTLFTELSTIRQPARHINDAMTIQLRSAYGISRVLNGWIPELGDYYIRFVIYILRVSLCIEPARLAPLVHKQGWGKPDFCRADHVKKYGGLRYSGSYSNAQAVASFYKIQFYLKKFDQLLNRRKSVFREGTPSVIIGNIRQMADICRRPVSKWNEKDTTIVFIRTISIVIAIGQAYGGNEGESLLKGYYGLYEEISATLGIDIETDYALIEKDLSRCGPYDLGGVLRPRGSNPKGSNPKGSNPKGSNPRGRRIIIRRGSGGLINFRYFGRICSHRKSASIFRSLAKYTKPVSDVNDASIRIITFARGFESIGNTWVKGLGTHFMRLVIVYLRLGGCTNDGAFVRWNKKYHWSTPDVCRRDFGKQWGWSQYRESFSRQSLLKYYQVSSSQTFFRGLLSGSKYSHPTERKIINMVLKIAESLNRKSFKTEDMFSGLFYPVWSISGYVGAAYNKDIGYHVTDDWFSTFKSFATRLEIKEFESSKTRVLTDVRKCESHRLGGVIRQKTKDDTIKITNDDESSDEMNDGENGDNQNNEEGENGDFEDSDVGTGSINQNSDENESSNDDDEDDDVRSKKDTSESDIFSDRSKIDAGSTTNESGDTSYVEKKSKTSENEVEKTTDNRSDDTSNTSSSDPTDIDNNNTDFASDGTGDSASEIETDIANDSAKDTASESSETDETTYEEVDDSESSTNRESGETHENTGKDKSYDVDNSNIKSSAATTIYTYDHDKQSAVDSVSSASSASSDADTDSQITEDRIKIEKIKKRGQSGKKGCKPKQRGNKSGDIDRDVDLGRSRRRGNRDGSDANKMTEKRGRGRSSRDSGDSDEDSTDGGTDSETDGDVTKSKSIQLQQAEEDTIIKKSQKNKRIRGSNSDERSQDTEQITRDRRTNVNRRSSKIIRLRHYKDQPLQIFRYAFGEVFASDEVRTNIIKISETKKKASNFNEGFEVILQVTQGLTPFLDGWQNGLGGYFNNIMWSILTTSACTRGGGIYEKSRAKGRGNLAICSNRYRHQWRLDEFSGSVTSRSDIFKFYKLNNVYRSLQRYSENQSGTERVVIDAILALARISEKSKSRQFSINDFLDAYGYFTTIIIAVSKGHNTRLGPYVEGGFYSYFESLFKTYDIQVGSRRSQWQKRAAKCGSASFRNQIRTQTTSQYVEEEEGTNVSSNDDDNGSGETRTDKYDRNRGGPKNGRTKSRASSDSSSRASDSDRGAASAAGATASSQGEFADDGSAATSSSSAASTSDLGYGAESESYSAASSSVDNDEPSASAAEASSSDGGDKLSASAAAASASRGKNRSGPSAAAASASGGRDRSGASAAAASSSDGDNDDGVSAAAASDSGGRDRSGASAAAASSSDGDDDDELSAGAAAVSDSGGKNRSGASAAAASASGGKNRSGTSAAAASASGGSDRSGASTAAASAISNSDGETVSNADSSSGFYSDSDNAAMNGGRSPSRVVSSGENNGRVMARNDGGSGSSSGNSYANGEEFGSQSEDGRGNFQSIEQKRGGSGVAQESTVENHSSQMVQTDQGRHSEQQMRQQQQVVKGDEKHDSGRHVFKRANGGLTLEQHARQQSLAQSQQQDAGEFQSENLGTDGSSNRQSSKFVNNRSNNAQTYKYENQSMQSN